MNIFIKTSIKNEVVLKQNLERSKVKKDDYFYFLIKDKEEFDIWKSSNKINININVEFVYVENFNSIQIIDIIQEKTNGNDLNIVLDTDQIINNISLSKLITTKHDFIFSSSIVITAKSVKEKTKKADIRIFEGSYIFDSSLLQLIQKRDFWDYDFNSIEILGNFLHSVSKNPKKLNIPLVTRILYLPDYKLNVKYLDKKELMNSFNSILFIENISRKTKKFLLREQMKRRKNKIYLIGFIFLLMKKQWSSFMLLGGTRHLEFKDLDKIKEFRLLEEITYADFKIKLKENFKITNKIFEKFNIKIIPIGMTLLGAKKGGEIINYDDDIDIAVDFNAFKKNEKEIIKEFKKEGLHILFWDAKNGPNSTISINKIFDGKLYKVKSNFGDRTAIATPFIDLTFSLNLRVGENYKYNKIQRTIKKLWSFSQAAPSTSRYTNHLNRIYNQWELKSNPRKIPFNAWKIPRFLLIKRYKIQLKKLSKENNNESGKLIWKHMLLFDYYKWGPYLIDLEKNDHFLGSSNIYRVIDYENLFKKRYGQYPEIHEDYLAVPSHLLKETDVMINNKNHWLNCKDAKKIISKYNKKV